MMKITPFFSFFVFSFLFFVTSCGCPHRLQRLNDPPPLPDYPMIASPIRLAVVLGAGGAKGLAHVGVLEEFEKANIPIDLIVGSSAGSFVGALYADCPNACYLKDLIPLLHRRILMDINVLEARNGLCQGRSMRKFLNTHLTAKTFDELKIPLFVVATDLNTGELVPIGGGPIVPAVEASCSIPFLFSPVELHGRALIDGSVIDPIPVRLARILGAEIVVAVDLQELLPQNIPTNLFGVATRSLEIIFLWQSERLARDADVLIQPQLGDIGCLDEVHHQFIYQAGREAGRKAIPFIIEALRKRFPECSVGNYDSEVIPSKEPDRVINPKGRKRMSGGGIGLPSIF